MLANMSIEPIITVYVRSLVSEAPDNESGGICDGSSGAGQHYFRLMAWKTGGLG